MTEKCATIIADWLVRCSAAEDADRELYHYAVYSIFLTLAPLMLAIGFGICMGCVGQSVMIIIPFTIIRKFSGGYHANHSWTCFFWSCLLLFLCITMSFRVRCDWTLAIITAMAAVSLICFSPIDNENRRLDQNECHSYKRITGVLVIAFCGLDALLYALGLSIYSGCISIGIMLSAGLQLPCVFMKLIKNHRK